MKGATDADAYRKAGFLGAQAHRRAAEIRARPDVDARIAEIRRENDRLSALSREEAMAFLADIVRTPIGDVSTSSPLCQEHSRTEGVGTSTERIKMPSKLDALKLLGSWCGWEQGTEAENKAANTLATFMAEVRSR